MGSFNGNRFQIFAPNVASEFEDLCVTIFRCVWSDQSAVKHGRSGQAQNGVDIYGKEKGVLVGVQCKKKDLTLNAHLTEDEILEEVKLAEGFEPPIKKLIIATTDASDAKLQKYVRKLSKEYEGKGLFSISLHSWDDLKTWIGQYWETVAPIHYPEFIQSESEKPKPDAPEEQIKAIDSGSLKSKSSKSNDTETVSNDVKVIQPDNIANELMNDEFGKELDHARDLIEANRFSDALAYLQDLKDRIWSKSNDNLKFRLLTNIASCQSRLGETTEAASNFFKAYEFNSSDDKARSNRAYAFMLAEDYSKAADAAREIIESNPMHSTAYAILVQALSYTGEDFKTIQDLVPKNLKSNQEIVYALANTAKKLGLHQESTKLLEDFVKNDDNDPEVLAYLAANIIEEVVSANKLAIRGHLAAEFSTKLENAAGYLKKAWKLIPDERDRKHSSFILHNLATAYRLMGELDKAQNVLDELLEIAPAEKNYKILAASIAYDRKDYERVKEVMSDLASGEDADPEAKVKLAEAHVKLGNVEDATQILKTFISDYPEQDVVWEDAHYHLLDIFTNTGQFDDALDLLDEFEKKGAPSVVIGVLRAKANRLQGNTDAALTLLEQTFNQIDISEPSEWLIEIAQEAYECKNYALAVKAYEAVIDPRTDTILTRRYLHSLYEIKQYKRVIEIAEYLRSIVGASRDITQFEWAAYQELQDLPHAKAVLKEYISQNSDDADAKLRLALLDFRSNDFESVDAYLSLPIDISKLDVFSAVQLANLYQLRGHVDRTLETLYELRRLHPNEADAHSAYVSIFLSLEETQDSDEFEPDDVKAGTVIFYEGGHIVIEDKHEPDIQHDEISPDEAKKRGYIGKKVGDKIVLSENKISGPVEAEITKIQSKYVYAFQEILKTYERRFQDRTDLMGIKFEADDITPLLKQIDEMHKQTESVEKLYREGKLTVDTFAKLLGKGYFDVFYGLRSIPDLGIRVSSGTIEEREEVSASLNKDPLIVADISAIITLYELGLSTEQIGCRLISSQSVRDLVKQELAKAEGIGKKKGATLYKSNGQYIHKEITPEESQKWLEKLRGLEEWIETNVDIKPITQEQLDTFNASQEKLGELLEQTQVDTLVLAEGEGRILLADDLMLRLLAKTTLSMDGACSQALLQHATEKGNITLKDYEQASIKLAESNYHHISINQHILMRAAQQSKWLPEEPFTATLKAITRKETTLQSLVVVLINFVYEFYKKPIPIDKSFIVQQILNEVQKNHDINIFLAGFDRAIDIRFSLLPTYAKELRETISNWASLHGV